ncbi:hypothetical protein GCM10022278_10610 [Allohahella marinimesophila]|uniref:Arginine N-succinyltransferase n=2 Tax=Allohahella marinimesophila TaxID=1054972 RepID=A0ABP7NTC8_9GAMM
MAVFLGVLLALLIAGWLGYNYVFSTDIEPVELNSAEEQALEQKIEQIVRAEPQPYSEDDAKRELSFSERELNALLARETDMAQQLAIDLSDDAASATFLVPLPPDFPIMAGKTVRLDAGLEIIQLEDSSIRIALKGVSVGGVPLPDAWLGNLKNVDLVSASEQGGSGFWKQVAAGVDTIRIRDGEVQLKLRP